MVCIAGKPDLEDNRNALIIGIYTTLLILAVVSVVLRLASRRISRAKLWWDDYCIIVALVKKTYELALHWLIVLRSSRVA